MRQANDPPPIDYVLEAVEYVEHGALIWKERPLHHFPDKRAMKIWNTKYKGKEAKGSLKHNGYRYIDIWKWSISLHRLIWFYHNKSIDGMLEVDHIDCDRSNNRIENLRLSTPNGNQHNKPLQKNNSSGYKNVYWHNQANRWVVRVTVNKRAKSFGLYNSKEDANEVAKKARAQLHGEFKNNG